MKYESTSVSTAFISLFVHSPQQLNVLFILLSYAHWALAARNTNHSGGSVVSHSQFQECY